MKTAGQAISDIFRQSFPGQHCELHTPVRATAADLWWAMRVYPRLKSIAGHCVVPHSDLELACNSLRYFTFLRDPVQRCVSHYQFLASRNEERRPFRKWLQHRANYQTRMLCGAPDAERAIEMLETKIRFVGLLERFDESLLLLRHWTTEPGLNLARRRRNVATDNRIKDEILSYPALVAKIHEHHAEDFRLYEYARDVVYPRQVADYGPALAADLAQLTSAAESPVALSLAHYLAKSKRACIYKPLATLGRWQRAA
jgi:hypothetical protein